MWHGPMQGNWTPGSSMLGSGVGMVLLVLLFWLLIVGGIVFLIWFVVSAVHQGQQVPPVSSETALQVLKRRLASGEITSDQYRDLRRALEE